MQISFRKGAANGFTIVELIIVIAVIGILATIGIVSYGAIQGGARDKTLLSDADAVAAEITRYSTKNNGTLGSAVAWYSGGDPNVNIKFAPSAGNVIDVVTSTYEYCIRAYNPAATKNSISNAITKESTPGTCINLQPSIAAGGTKENSLVAWWKLNGNAVDETGNSGPGTVVGAATAMGQTGVASTAYSFDGVDDRINLGLVPELGKLTNNLTVSAWINEPEYSYAFGRAILSTERLNSANGIGLSTVSAAIRFTTYTVRDYLTSTVTLSPNTWYLITVVMTNNNATVYLNGVSQQTITHTTGGVANLDDNAWIGATTIPNTSALSELFLGRIDDVRVYNRPLTAGEVMTLYTANAQ